MGLPQIAIVGLGASGRSALQALYGNAQLLVLDTREQPPGLAEIQRRFPDASFVAGAHSWDFGQVDRVIVSPGVPLEHCLIEGAIAAGAELGSDIDLFFERVTRPVIGITGTNGKSTVTSMVGHILAVAGSKVAVGGNLGQPALTLLDDRPDRYVLELSSFQLERMAAHRLDAATILNISEDHLDRHASMPAYLQAKQRIYRNAELAVWNRDDPETVPQADAAVDRLTSFGVRLAGTDGYSLVQQGKQRWFSANGSKICPAEELGVVGAHNEANFLAACALLDSEQLPAAVLAEAARSFAGLPHRSVLVRTRKGVRYVNDSKATNVGATLAALNGLGGERNIVLIAGGEGKGADFNPLQIAGAHLRYAVLLGQDGPELANTLGRAGVSTSVVESLADAVTAAVAAAHVGDVVLLSPACASFDMFDNYADRGRQFTELVQAL